MGDRPAGRPEPAALSSGHPTLFCTRRASMPEATRRAVLTGAAGLSRPSAPAIVACGAVSGREVMRERYFPNVLLTTQEGRQVRFYDDLIKDKIVIIQLMYTNCGDICPLAT